MLILTKQANTIITIFIIIFCPFMAYCDAIDIHAASINALVAFRAAANEYGLPVENLEASTYAVYQPDRYHTWKTGAISLTPIGCFGLVKHADSDGNESVWAQFRSDLEGHIWHTKFFRQPTASFGRLGVSELEAAQKANINRPIKSGESALVEMNPFEFYWRFERSNTVSYVDTHEGNTLTEDEMLKQLTEGFPPIKAEPRKTMGNTIDLYDGLEKTAIEMLPDTIGIIIDSESDESTLNRIASSYNVIQSYEKVNVPFTMTYPPVWLVHLKKSLTNDEITRLTQEMSKQDNVDVACPVFRMEDYSGSTFDFMFTFYLNLTVFPSGIEQINEILQAQAGIKIMSERQTAVYNPIRFILRGDPSQLPVTDLIHFSNRLCNDSNTKYAGLVKLVVYHPQWDRLMERASK